MILPACSCEAGLAPDAPATLFDGDGLAVGLIFPGFPEPAAARGHALCARSNWLQTHRDELRVVLAGASAVPRLTDADRRRLLQLLADLEALP